MNEWDKFSSKVNEWISNHLIYLYKQIKMLNTERLL